MDYLQKVNDKKAAALENNHKKAVVASFDNLSSSIRELLESLEKTGAKRLDKDFISSVRGLEKVSKTLSSIKIEADQDIKSGLRVLATVLKGLDTKPVVNVSPAQVNVQERDVDFSPLIKVLNKLESKPPIVKVDNDKLSKEVTLVKEAINNLEFPVANYVLPFKDINGAAAQVQLDASGNIPTTASFSPSGTQDVNITKVGGNAVTTTVPIAGTVTANAGTNLNTSLLALESGGNLATIAGKDFATQTTLAAINAKLVSGTDIGDVDVLGLGLTGNSATLKDDSGFGEGVTSGIATVHARLWDGAAYDRQPGNSTDGALVNLGANNDVSLNAGTNGIGKLTANSGVDIGDVTINNASTEPVYVGSAKSSSAATTTTGVSVGSASTTVLASNANRIKAIIVNDSDEVVYLKYGSGSEMNKGIRLNSSGGVIIEEYYTGIITGICASGSKNVTVTELG